MRKMFLLLTAMVLLLAFSSTAFASQSESFVFYGDSKIGSVSDGYQGYSWNHSDSKHVSIVRLNDYQDYSWNHSDSKRVSIVELKNLSKRYFYKWNNDTRWQRNWDNRDSVRYFYVDEKGVSHYFYLDSDRDYAVHQYKDKNGTTQFKFEDKGWK